MADAAVDTLLEVEFVSPEEILYSGKADTVVARTRGGGDIAFLFGHEPFIGSLIPSQVIVYEVEEGNRTEKIFCVRGGFVSVTGEKVTVLSDAAISADSIDLAQVKADLAEAEQALEAEPENIFHEQDRVWAQVQIDAVGGE